MPPTLMQLQSTLHLLRFPWVAPPDGREKHPSRLDIPTPSCDRDDVSFTFRDGGDSLFDC